MEKTGRGVSRVRKCQKKRETHTSKDKERPQIALNPTGETHQQHGKKTRVMPDWTPAEKRYVYAQLHKLAEKHMLFFLFSLLFY